MSLPNAPARVSENPASVSLGNKLTSDVHKQKMKLNQATSSNNWVDQRSMGNQRFLPTNTVPRSNPLTINNSRSQQQHQSVYYAVHFPTEPKQVQSTSYNNAISSRSLNSLESVSSTPPPYLDADYEAFASDASSWSSSSSNYYYGHYNSSNPIFLQPVMYDRDLIHYSDAEQFRLEPLEADYVNSDSSVQYSIDIVSPIGAIGASD
jgi:hypothetical protein